MNATSVSTYTHSVISHADFAIKVAEERFEMMATHPGYVKSTLTCDTTHIHSTAHASALATLTIYTTYRASQSRHVET